MVTGSVASWIGLLLATAPPAIILTAAWLRTSFAERRSYRMLRDVLSEPEYHQLVKQDYLEVPSPSLPERVYRIPRQPGRVAVYEHGERVMELCLQPVKPLPPGDLVVMHKLLIQANEEAYLKTANHFRPGIYTFPAPPLMLWY